MPISEDYTYLEEGTEYTKLAQFDDPTNYPRGRNDGSMRGVVIFLRHAQIIYHRIKRFVRENEVNFTNPDQILAGAQDPTRSKTIAGLSTEDISRINCLLFFVKHKSKQSKGTKAGKVAFWDKMRSGDRKGMAENKSAVPALFKLKGGAPPPNAHEKDQQAVAIRLQQFMDLASRTPDMVGSIGGEMTEEDHTKVQDIVKRLGMASAPNASTKRKARVVRQLARIDDSLFDQAITTITLGLYVLYDRTEDEARAAHLNADDLRNLTQMGTLAGDLGNQVDDKGSKPEFDLRLSLEMQREAQGGLAAVYQAWDIDVAEGEEMDIDNLESKVKAKAVKTAFQRFLSSINSVSAIPPDFDETVKAKGLKVEHEEDGTPVVMHNQIRLLPHQVVGIEYLVGMLLSNLRAAVLADDTGLGKTIQAIATHDKINTQIREGLAQLGRKFHPPQAHTDSGRTKFPLRRIRLSPPL